MRELINDIKGEAFTRREVVMYGIVYPLGLIVACMVAEALIWWPVLNS
jgi:hypothetical protein